MATVSEPKLWSAEDYLRCIPFSDDEIRAAIRRHEESACDGACLSAGAGREVLRLRATTRRVREGLL